MQLCIMLWVIYSFNVNTYSAMNFPNVSTFHSEVAIPEGLLYKFILPPPLFYNSLKASDILAYKWYQVFSNKEVFSGSTFHYYDNHPLGFVIETDKMDNNTNILCRLELGSQQILISNETLRIIRRRRKYLPRIIKYTDNENVKFSCDTETLDGNLDSFKILKFKSKYSIEDDFSTDVLTRIYYSMTHEQTYTKSDNNTILICISYQKAELKWVIRRRLIKKSILVYTNPKVVTDNDSRSIEVFTVIICIGGFLTAVIGVVCLMCRRRRNNVRNQTVDPMANARDVVIYHHNNVAACSTTSQENNDSDKDEHIYHYIYDYPYDHLIKLDTVPRDENERKSYMDMTHNCYVDINTRPAFKRST